MIIAFDRKNRNSIPTILLMCCTGLQLFNIHLGLFNMRYQTENMVIIILGNVNWLSYEEYIGYHTGLWIGIIRECGGYHTEYSSCHTGISSGYYTGIQGYHKRKMNSGDHTGNIMVIIQEYSGYHRGTVHSGHQCMVVICTSILDGYHTKHMCCYHTGYLNSFHKIWSTYHTGNMGYMGSHIRRYVVRYHTGDIVGIIREILR